MPKTEPKIELMYFCRPLYCGESTFGAVTLFFNPIEIDPTEIEAVGKMMMDVLDNYWLTRKGVQYS